MFEKSIRKRLQGSLCGSQQSLIFSHILLDKTTDNQFNQFGIFIHFPGSLSHPARHRIIPVSCILRSAMKFDLLPGIPLRTGTFNALVAPPELVAGALDASEQVSRFTLLYISGSTSRILASLHHRSPSLDVRRADTGTDLKMLLDTACHTIVLIEHDPQWYPGTGEISHGIGCRLRELAETTLVMLCTREPDQSFDLLCHAADRIFFICPPPETGTAGHRHLHPSCSRHTVPPSHGQSTLEVS